MIRDAQEDLQHMAQVTSQTRHVNKPVSYIPNAVPRVDALVSLDLFKFLLCYWCDRMTTLKKGGVSTILKQSFLNASHAFAPAFRILTVMNVDHAHYWANVKRH
ncbi:hypothetical protein Gotur_001920 [Gossypium turneri]